MNIETVVVGPFEVGCYIAWSDPKQTLVIDPGWDADAILAVLASKHLTVAMYVLTHGHVDHICGLADMHAAQPAPIAMHPADMSWAFEGVNQMLPFYPAPKRPAAKELLLDDGHEFPVGPLACRVIHTPGHSPGCICLHLPGEQVLFSGDTLFAGSIGRTDFPGGDSDTMLGSLRLLAQLPDDTRVYPGHGPSTTIGREKRVNPFMRSI